MTKEMETLFIIFYEACYNYFEDVRMGRDESYSKGWMDALQKVINIAGMDMGCSTSFSYAIIAVMDEAECDDAVGDEKLSYEIVALATKAMEKAAKGEPS